MKSIKTVHEKCVGNHLDPIFMNQAACWMCLLSCWRKRLYPIAAKAGICRDFRLRMMINDFRCKGLDHSRPHSGPLPLFVFLRRLMGLVVVFPSQLTQNSDLGKGWQAILVHRPLAAWLVIRLSISVTEAFPEGCDTIILVDLDTYMMVFVVSTPCCRATGNLAGDIIIGLGAHLFEIREEENILTMDSVERVPDLERLIGVEAAISNRSRGGKARVSEFGIQIEAHQFFIIRVESIARE
ncbi:hypothetical protein OIU85_022381 [Salix viminalis]|uniref:Uncharacterized protein n=1 Tax=Salix viminalis TaxID=40686 RepID=A0A9Q0U6Q0_SALVM|nr:hypothetical protein OIU85_022381 [Salix viminalis]